MDKKGFKKDPGHFLGYLLAHEWYHIGETGMSKRQAGYPVPVEAAMALWERWQR